MKNCPQCGQPRQGEAFKCPQCDVFYSQLDEILFADQLQREQHTLKGRIKAILAAADRKKALYDELKTVWKTTPLQTKIALWTIFAFLFVLIVPI